MLYECLTSVSKAIQESSNSVSKVSQGCFKSISRALYEFKEYFKGVSKVVAECFKRVL